MIVAVVGATATGKSELALEIAEELAGEVIGGDAMQLYRGMDIGTAKLPIHERRGIPHHQIDVLDLHQEASVAAYQHHARSDIAAIERRGASPIVVGGSGLYLRAVLDEMEFPGTDPLLRQRLDAELEELGSATLHERLNEVDPVAALRIDPANGRRIVRALEVVELTGRPFSATLPARIFRKPTVQIGLRTDLSVLDERIELRARRMVSEGLIDEVEQLVPLGLAETKTASRATGYRQVMEYLEGGMSKDSLVDAIAQATRSLARRQIKWFRADPRIRWIDATGAGQMLDQALGLLRDAEYPESTP